MNEILAIVKSRLTQEFPVQAETPLMRSGLIDSFGVAGLLVEVRGEARGAHRSGSDRR